MGEEHPLRGLHKKARTLSQFAHESFENDVLNHILQTFKLTGERRRLEKIAERRTGEPNPKLVDLVISYHFPVALAAYSSGQKQRSDKVHQLFKDFSKNPLFERFIYERKILPMELRGRPFALVIPWPYIPKGVAIHTNGQRGDDVTCFVWRKGSLELTIEPLTQFVAGVGDSWLSS